MALTHTFFISDLHLGAPLNGDRIAHERVICRWLDEIAPRAKALYLLGDIIDYWYEYRDVVPRGFVRFLGTLARMADNGTEIYWLKGNHDIWIFDYLPTEIPLTAIDGLLVKEIDGKQFVMEHGDGVGEVRRSYRLMHRFFRNRFCQWLFAGIHPRWTVGFAHSWSSHSRAHGRKPTFDDRLPDDHPLARFAREWLADRGHVDYFIFGHLHKLVDQPIAPDSRLVILGDGFERMTYAVWDGENLSIEKINTNESAPFNQF